MGRVVARLALLIATLTAVIGAACSAPSAMPDGGADCELHTWYADRDGDGLGAAGLSITSCSGFDGYVLDATDCDDSSALIGGSVRWHADEDGDGHGARATSTLSCDTPPGYVTDDEDCDDTDSAIHLGASERCNAEDDDCDGATDEGAPTTSWYADVDQDGYGVPGTVVISCAAPNGSVTNSSDCNDSDGSIHPNAFELGCGVDRNCDGTFTPCCGDGYLDRDTGEQCDPPQDGGCLGQCNACACPAPGPWQFTDATAQAGLLGGHAYLLPPPPPFTFHTITLREAGGLAASDLDDDGDIDLYSVGGNLGRSVLWINQGNGTFADRTVAAQLPAMTGNGNAPLFADLDGDGADDLLLGGVAGTPLRVFVNQRNGTFVDRTVATGLAIPGEIVSAAMADIDGDGDLDLALARWGTTGSGQSTCTGAPPTNIDHLWRNDGGIFTPVSAAAGLASLQHPVLCYDTTHTPNFDYFNGDDRIDLAFAADFGATRLYLGAGTGVFSDITTSAIDDEFGMGACTGDIDNDGDVDWFVTSISGLYESGNRLYINDGSGNMTDRSVFSGVREGGWGWGTCMADFNNDSHLDLFMVNGFTEFNRPEFLTDPSRLFLSKGDGTFSERSFDLGLRETDQGRGVSCFDSDGNGAIDIVVSNNQGPLRLWRNNGTRAGHYLVVSLSARAPNARAIGARVELTIAGVTQRRTIKAGSNFASQDPALAHFGLGAATVVDRVRVRWPDGTVNDYGPYTADQRIVVIKP